MAILLEAAGRGDLALVQELISAGHDVDQPDGGMGTTPLLAAAKVGHAEVVLALLQAGASVDTRDTTHMTPLHAACRPANTAVAAALLAAGANVHARNHHGSTPLVHSLFFLEEGAGNRNVLQELAAQLLAAGSDAQAADIFGNTALHYAAALADVDLVEALLARGSQAHARDSLERTPLHWLALSLGESPHAAVEAVARLLVTAGAPIDARNERGNTPLCAMVSYWAAASQAGGLGVLQYLLSAGANVAARDMNGSTLLWHLLCDVPALNPQQGGEHEAANHQMVEQAAWLLLQARAPVDGLPAAASERLLRMLMRQVAEANAVTPALRQLVVEAAAALSMLHGAQRGGGQRQ